MGRPKGSKNKTTILREKAFELYQKEAQQALASGLGAVINAVLKKAKEGDMAAAKLVLDRVVPTRKSVQHMHEGGDMQITVSVAKPMLPVIEGEAEEVEE